MLGTGGILQYLLYHRKKESHGVRSGDIVAGYRRPDAKQQMTHFE